MASNAASGWRETMKQSIARSATFLSGIGLFLLAIMLALALASYSQTDPSLNTAAGVDVQNLMGWPGAIVSDLMLAVFGPVSVLFVVLLCVFGIKLVKDEPLVGAKRRIIGCVLAIIILCTAFALWRGGGVLKLPAGYGGAVGIAGAKSADWVLEFISGENMRSWARFFVALLLFIGGVGLAMVSLSLPRPKIRALGNLLPKVAAENESRPAEAPTPEKRRARVIDVDGDDIDFAVDEDAGAAEKPARARMLPIPRKSKPKIADRIVPVAPAKPTDGGQGMLDLRDDYRLPAQALLTEAPAPTGAALDKAGLERNARLLEFVLDDFNVKGEIVHVRPGPIVTMYELEPAPGTKASRVIQLADDIARNMSAFSARIATIPGRTVIGIELPNQKREPVVLRELIASTAFSDQQASLPIVLGKNIAGDPVVADLAPMPHLLVAGTTGSGKSVGLNCMILSLLYRMTPSELRLIMIDPKMLELSIYEDIPHLLAPVVTEPPKAIRALKWAVEQMEERYRMMASVGVRNLSGFNEKVRAAKSRGKPLGRKIQIGYDPDTRQPIYEEEQLDFEPLPQIVVIVDELADLMMTAGKEVEFLIQRLAQKARAAGIHLIMATQRPSVDVITGVIKANLPSRISFQVTSKIDSRTILGEQGAEQLLGKGDMLYMAGGKNIMRVHGPFVSDEEVLRVADHWRDQGKPDYIDAVTSDPEDGGGFALDGAPEGEDSAEERTYRKAVELVSVNQRASVSWLQRQLRVGFNSASRLIERMEDENIVSRPDHVGRREVLLDTDGRPR